MNLLWSSIQEQSVRFIDERLSDSESDLLYAIERKGGGAPAWCCWSTSRCGRWPPPR